MTVPVSTVPTDDLVQQLLGARVSAGAMIAKFGSLNGTGLGTNTKYTVINVLYWSTIYIQHFSEKSIGRHWS